MLSLFYQDGGMIRVILGQFSIPRTIAFRTTGSSPPIIARLWQLPPSPRKTTSGTTPPLDYSPPRTTPTLTLTNQPDRGHLYVRS